MQVGYVALNRFSVVVLVSGLLGLAGCSGGTVGGLQQTAVSQAASKAPGAKLKGSVRGGQFPIAYANVYVFAAGVTGYGAPSSSLLGPAADTMLDTSGGATDGDYYVATDSNGNFGITLGDYTCTQNTQVYLYTLGGDPGLGTGVNPAAGLMAVLGNCPAAGNFSGTSLAISEVSTVAAAYAMAGFASDALHVSSSGTALAQVGIANAFANAANLASQGTGTALATTPAGNGVVPQAEINMLANILAACVNSNGAVTDVSSNPTACYTLFTGATSDGTPGGVQPTDTATAAINIAHHPGANVASLFSLPVANPPFLPVLAGQPNDFTIALMFTPGNLDLPKNIAIDGSGNAWITSQDTFQTSIVELSSAGAVLSGADGYVGGGMDAPWGVAIDISGNAWVTNNAGNTVTELSSSGSVLSGVSGYTSALMSGPTGIAIDASGNAWIANTGSSTVAELSSAGSDSSGPEGFFSNDMSGPTGIAIDAAGDAWIANAGGASVTELSNWGTNLSGTTGWTASGMYQPGAIAIDAAGDAWVASEYSDGGGDPGNITELYSSGASVFGVGGLSGGGLQNPVAIAIDGGGNVWVADLSNSIVELSNSAGLPLSGTSGYQTGSVHPPAGIAIDGSGDVWVTIPGSTAVAEMVGAATPVVTPLAVGVENNTLGTQP